MASVWLLSRCCVYLCAAANPFRLFGAAHVLDSPSATHVAASLRSNVDGAVGAVGSDGSGAAEHVARACTSGMVRFSTTARVSRDPAPVDCGNAFRRTH